MKIGFIGAGKVGKALGLYWKDHGLELSGYYSRSPQSARDAAALTESQAFSTLKEVIDVSEILFLTVPDAALEEVDRAVSVLLQVHKRVGGKIWFHVSGAYPASCLTGILELGYDVGSLHPLESFGGSAAASAKRLERVWFTVEGTDKAVETARTILEKTGGQYSRIDPAGKPLYHAGACVISNFFVTLIESGIKLFEASGMEREAILEAVPPLMEASWNNLREQGAVDALTGPIVRADFETVGVHLKAMAEKLPAEMDFYKAMARKTAGMIENRRLSRAQTEKLQRMLEGTSYDR